MKMIVSFLLLLLMSILNVDFQNEVSLSPGTMAALEELSPVIGN